MEGSPRSRAEGAVVPVSEVVGGMKWTAPSCDHQVLLLEDREGEWAGAQFLHIQAVAVAYRFLGSGVMQTSCVKPKVPR